MLGIIVICLMAACVVWYFNHELNQDKKAEEQNKKDREKRRRERERLSSQSGFVTQSTYQTSPSKQRAKQEVGSSAFRKQRRNDDSSNSIYPLMDVTRYETPDIASTPSSAHDTNHHTIFGGGHFGGAGASSDWGGNSDYGSSHSSHSSHDSSSYDSGSSWGDSGGSFDGGDSGGSCD